MKGHKMMIKFKKWFETQKEFAKGAHSIHTPFDLVNEVNSKITFGTKNILVLFNVEFCIDLVYNRRVNPKQITFYSDHSDKDQMAKMLGLKTIKSLETNMQFDVILTNPPYDVPMEKKKQTKKVWPEFVHKALDRLAPGGTLGFICPPSWVLSNDAKLKKIRNRVLENNLTDLRLGVQKFFPTVNIQIGYFLLENKTYSKKTNFIDAGKDNAVVIDFNNGIPLTPEEQTRVSLVDKIIESSNKKYQWSSYGEDIKKTKEAIDRLRNNNKKLKVIINYSKAYYTDKVQDNNMPITTDPINNKQVCLVVNSKKEGLNHKSFLHSKPIRWLANNYKRRGQTGFCDAVKRQIIPQFETKMWTDKDVYKALGLNAKEIAYIETNI
jgi:hypothetical protein